MTNSFKAFMESRAYSAFDTLGAEEYFAGVEDAPDCMPANVREWTRVANQLERMSDLVRRARAKDPSISKCVTDAAIRKEILGEEPYKKSIFEIQEDVMAHLDHPSKLEFGNSRRMAIFADHLEHFGFPTRLKAHMAMIRSMAAMTNSKPGTFSYDKRGDVSKKIVADVIEAANAGVDISRIIIQSRTNTGGPADYKGGINTNNAKVIPVKSGWYRITEEFSYIYYTGDLKFAKTINISFEQLRKLSETGVKEIEYSGGIVLDGLYMRNLCPKMRLKSLFVLFTSRTSRYAVEESESARIIMDNIEHSRY